MMFFPIFVVDFINNVGYKNTLPWNISSEIQYCRFIIKKNILIVGYSTFLSIKGSFLKNCFLIIMSRKKNVSIINYFFSGGVFFSLLLCLSLFKKIILLKLRNKNFLYVYLIGGISIYKFFFPFCNLFYVTYIYGNFLGNSFFYFFRFFFFKKKFFYFFKNFVFKIYLKKCFFLI